MPTSAAHVMLAVTGTTMLAMLGAAGAHPLWTCGNARLDTAIAQPGLDAA